MPNPSVFSAEQREFLSDLVNDFVTAQAGATTADFLVNTYRDFVARWPNAAPTLSEILVHSDGKFTDMPSDDPDKIKALAEAQTKAEDAVAAKMSNVSLVMRTPSNKTYSHCLAYQVLVLQSNPGCWAVDEGENADVIEGAEAASRLAGIPTAIL